MFMQNIKKRINIIVVILMLMILGGCSTENKQSENVIQQKKHDKIFDMTKEDERTDTKEATQINLTDYSDGLTISEGGDYWLYGNMDGSLLLDTEDQNIHLFLSNTSIKAQYGPAIESKGTGKVFITCVKGTQNYISDSAYYDDAEKDACVYVNGNLTFNGVGKLTVIGLYKDAIHCKDIVKMISSNAEIISKRDGLRGNDGVYVKGDNIRIEAEANGIRTTKDGKRGRGSVEIVGNNMSIICGKYSIVSASNLLIHDSSIYLKGIYGSTSVAGVEYIEGGNIING